MTPEQFVATLDEWTARGGEFPDHAFDRHYLTTADEANAVVRALTDGDLNYSAGKLPTPNLHDVVALLQNTYSPEVDDVFQRFAMPQLRRIVREGLKLKLTPSSSDDDKVAAWTLRKRADSYLFALKVASFYGGQQDAELVASAARSPAFEDHYLWSSIFEYSERRNPAAEEMLERLRTPLPRGFCRIAYLDFANKLAFDSRASSHPFDTEIGCEFLLEKLEYDDASYESYAISAVGAAPFLSEVRRAQVLERARSHSSAHLQTEADWAEARLGGLHGSEFLLASLQVPQTATRAARYLTSLGMPTPPPQNPDEFDALRQVSDWLSNEEDFLGRAPKEIFVIDQRALRWPPNGDERRVWLIGFRHDSEDERMEGVVSISDGHIDRHDDDLKAKPIRGYGRALGADPDVYTLYDGDTKDGRFWEELVLKFNPTVERTPWRWPWDRTP